MVENESSVDTSHRTDTGTAGMPPPVAGSGARRVQRITLSANGSPEATPSVNGSPTSSGTGSVVVLSGTVVVLAGTVVELPGPLGPAWGASSEQPAATSAPDADASRNPRRDSFGGIIPPT